MVLIWYSVLLVHTKLTTAGEKNKNRVIDQCDIPVDLTVSFVAANVHMCVCMCV